MTKPGTNAGKLDRRELLGFAAAFGPAFLATQGLLRAENLPEQQILKAAPTKRYDMKKSINMWAFPYPGKMSLTECFQLAKDAGFEGIEVNFNLEGDISPEASEQQLIDIGNTARKIGIEISGVCSFLFWPYALSSNDAAKRKQGIALCKNMIKAAKALGTQNLLVVPGAVYIPWLPEIEPVPNDVCWQRATEAIREVLPVAKQHGIYLNMENIFTNAFLFSPQEMNAFVDQFESEHVKVHFDTGNIMQYQFPEHWVPILGKRIQNIHLKESSKKVHEFSLDTFRPLLDGTTNWPAVLESLDAVGYRGYLTFEYFHPYEYWPEALIYQTSDSLDRMLGRK